MTEEELLLQFKDLDSEPIRFRRSGHYRNFSLSRIETWAYGRLIGHMDLILLRRAGIQAWKDYLEMLERRGYVTFTQA
jgi:hypothetical protein